jgi:hypothetical protein
MADNLQVNSLKSELIALRNAQAGRSVPDAKIARRISEIESEIGRKSSGTVTTPAMRKGGSVIKKSGSKAAKAGVTKFSPVKTKMMAEGGVATANKGLTKKQTAKVGKVMGAFKDKSLHSGKGGKVVKNPKQAIAIALSEARKVKK